LNVIEPALLRKLLGAEDHRVRASAVRVLRFWQNEIEDSIDLLDEMVRDEHPRVRLQAVLACGFNSSQRAAVTALQVTRHPMDAGLKKALDDTMDYFETLRTTDN
jgi:HEAT repeat protein